MNDALPEMPTLDAETAPAKWYTVKEAADILGITARAVQMRVKNATLVSRKEAGNRLMVQLEPMAQVKQAAPPAEVKQSDPPAPDDSALLLQLQSEVEFLRGLVTNHHVEIERRDVAEAELRRLLLQSNHLLEDFKQKITLLESAPVPTEPEPQQEAPRGLRKIFPNLFQRS